VPRLAGVDAPAYSRLVLEDVLALEGDPVAAEGAVARLVLERNGAFQHFKPLDEGASGIEPEFD